MTRKSRNPTRREAVLRSWKAMQIRANRANNKRMGRPHTGRRSGDNDSTR